MSELSGAPKAIFNERLVMEPLLEKHFAFGPQELRDEPAVIVQFGETNGSVDLGKSVIYAAHRAQCRREFRPKERVEQQIARFLHLGETATKRIEPTLGIAELRREAAAYAKADGVERPKSMLVGVIDKLLAIAPGCRQIAQAQEDEAGLPRQRNAQRDRLVRSARLLDSICSYLRRGV